MKLTNTLTGVNVDVGDERAEALLASGTYKKRAGGARSKSADGDAGGSKSDAGGSK